MKIIKKKIFDHHGRINKDMCEAYDKGFNLGMISGVIITTIIAVLIIYGNLYL